RHNDLNRFRAELFFSGAIDEGMGMNFTKHDVDPQQAVLDKIRELTNGQIQTIRSRVKTARVIAEDKEISHDESAKIISSKSHLLIQPKPKRDTDGKNGNKGQSDK